MKSHEQNHERNALCDSFTSLEQWTWNSMEQSARNALTIGEESITDFALLFLKTQNPHSVFIRKFTRRKERKIGADWEWWFTDGKRWFGMLVQAKRLNSASRTYDNLTRGTHRYRSRQVNALIRNAGARNPQLYPAYCFYNWLSGLRPNQQVCQCRNGAHLLGVTIADAYGIKKLIVGGTSQYGDVSLVARPIHCLVCCSLHDVESLAEAARDKARDLRALTEPNHIRAKPVPATTTRPPRYVRSVVDQKSAVDPAEPPRPGLGGIVVIRVIPR